MGVLGFLKIKSEPPDLVVYYYVITTALSLLLLLRLMSFVTGDNLLPSPSFGL